MLAEASSGVDTIFQLLLHELTVSTKAPRCNCEQVAARLTQEVDRICIESQRIQASGEVEIWAKTLARHRLNQCLTYYQLGSQRGRVELHSTLSAIVYRYMRSGQSQSSYQSRLMMIEDFLQGFYIEALNAFRREAQLPSDYSPHTLLDLAEYMAFTERYGKRRIPLPGRRSQQLIVLRAQTFSQQQPQDALVDIEQAAEGASSEAEHNWNAASLQRVREQMVAQGPEGEDSLRQSVITELMNYLAEKQQQDCADYFALRLQDLSANEIEAILNLTPRQRDYLQQRFKYHLIRFALSHRWELVHQWLDADLEHNFGLTWQQWQSFQTELTPQQVQLLHLKQQRLPELAIAQKLGCTMTQLQKRWSKLLEQAWEIRNHLASGFGVSTYE